MRSGRAAHPRRVVLITGMSGTGKSTTLLELARRGHAVIDTDEPGWIVDAPTPDGPEPVWELGRMGRALDEHRTGWLFVGGCVVNQRLLYGRFDAVVLLSAPRDVLLARVVDRANPFGSAAQDRARIIRDLIDVEPVMRDGAGHEIVTTTTSVADVADRLEEIAAAV